MTNQQKLELVVLTAILLALIASTIAWIRARDKLARAAEEDAAEREGLEAERDAKETEKERLRHALDEERRIGQQLRRKMVDLNRGVLHDPSDTRELVLQTAISLLEADRGLLLGRDDADGDGNLDVICAVGFDGHDLQKDPFVQSLGGRTLDRGETLREHGGVAMPVYIAEEFDGALVCEKDEGDFAEFEDEVLLALGDHAGAALGNSRLRGELRSAYLGTVRSLADAIEAKDPSVRTHSEEVARYVEAVAARLELEPQRREELLFGSLLHDIGKIGISERILLKPGRLTDDEYAVIKLHPRIGHRLVAGIPALSGIAPAVLHHHERYDGSGYPAGLEGERIPLEARIVGVADSFSAMIADRPYSQGRSPQEACDELKRCAGTQFDPEVVRLFVDEVRCHPPGRLDSDGAEAILDSELAVHRNGDGPLGSQAFALVDSLTLLHSAAYLHELADAEARRAALGHGSFGVIVAEVSSMEDVNRREGFAAGDRLLIEVADALRRSEAPTAGTACRLGGRRFALIVRDADEAAVRAAGDQIVEEIGGRATCLLAATSWSEGDSGFDVVGRAQRTLKENRATGTGGRASSRA